MTAITNIMRIMQQNTYPAVVAVSDVRFLIVITNTINKQFTKMIPDSIARRPGNILYLRMIPEITAS